MAAPLLIAMGIGAAASIWSAYEQANAIREQAEFQAKMQELNAQLAEVDAAEVYRQGVGQQVDAITQGERVSAQQTAALAQAGANIKDAGATQDLVIQSDVNQQLNLIDIENAAFMNASQFKREAAGRRDQAAVTRNTGQSAARNAIISGYASALSQGANAAASGMGKSAGTSKKTGYSNPSVGGAVANMDYRLGQDFGSGGI